MYATCRTASEGLKALDLNGGKILEGIDVGQDSVGEKLQASLKGLTLDTVINNAGILCIEKLGEEGALDSMRQQFEINTLGPLRVSHAVSENIKQGGSLFIITSLMGSITDNGSGGMYGYRMSKAAVNMAGVSLSKELAPRKIVVQLLHPGMVKTDMTAVFGGGIPVEESAAGLIARINEATMETTGKFFHQNGKELPW